MGHVWKDCTRKVSRWVWKEKEKTPQGAIKSLEKMVNKEVEEGKLKP